MQPAGHTCLAGCISPICLHNHWKLQLKFFIGKNIEISFDNYEQWWLELLLQCIPIEFFFPRVRQTRARNGVSRGAGALKIAH